MRITHNSLNNSPESSDRIHYIVSEQPQRASLSEFELAERAELYSVDDSWTPLPNTNNASHPSEEFFNEILAMLFPAHVNNTPTSENSNIQTTNASHQAPRHHRFFEVTEANMQTTHTNTRRRSPTPSEESENKRTCYR